MNNSSLQTATSTNDNSVFYLSGFNLVGLILNTLVIVIACRPNVIPGKIPLTFLLNQLAADFISCLLQSLAWLTNQVFWVPDNGWGTLICKLMYQQWLYFGAVHTSYTNIVLLAVERYVMIIHPSLHDKFTPPLNAFVIFLSWASGYARILPQFLSSGRSGTTCIALPLLFDFKTESTFLLFWSLVLPVIAIACLNGRVIYVLKQHAKKLHTPASTSTAAANPNVALRQRLHNQMAYSVATICLAYVVTVAPIAIVHTMMAYGVIEFNFHSPLFVGVTYVSSMFYLINPLVCIFFMQSIRRQVVAMFSCLRRNDDHAEEKRTMSTEAGINAIPTTVKNDEPVILAAI